MVGFAINPPNSPLTDARGYVTSPWYRWFARVQDVLGEDLVAAIAAAPVLTYSPTTAFSADKVLTAGTGIGLTSAASTLTVALTASGVTAASYGAADTVPTFTVDTFGRLTAAADVAIAISASAITSGTLAVARGGTGLSSYTVGDIIYASGATALSSLADVATGNALISGGVGVAPSWGKVGLTTHISGTLPIANGGTELATTPTNGQLLIGNGTNYTLATITGTANQITVTNGAGTIAISLPATINVNTSGSAATLTTPRAIYGNNFDGSAAITAIIASTYGGTGNGFTAFSGPTTAEKTFTLPDASATILTDNTDVTVAQGGTGASTEQAACANLKTPYILAASAVAASHTGDTSETTLATVTIPADAMGANGIVRVTTQWSYTNSANNKRLRTRFNGAAGTAYQDNISTATATARHQTQIANRNATNSQVGGSAGLGAGFGVSSGAIVTSAVDTTAAVDIVIRAQLTNTGETITLESYLVELIRP